MTDASPCGASDNSGCNAAIHLDGVTGVTLDNIEITTTAQNGINIRETSNLSILNSLVTLTGAGGQTEEGGIYALNLSGPHPLQILFSVFRPSVEQSFIIQIRI